MPPPFKKPRSLGTSFHQDKSLELYRDVGHFLRKHLDDDDGERVVLTRLAARPCLVLGSSEAAAHFLRRDDDDFYNGLKDFFFGLFGHSILFAEAAEVRVLRAALAPMFDRESVAQYGKVIDEEVDRWIEGLLARPDSKVVFYESFKRLSLVVNLRVFLGVKEAEQPELLESLSAAATAHWHGIISVPLNVRVPLFAASSSYRRALEAKEQLLGVIRARMALNRVDFLDRMRASSDLDDEQVANHVLIFACALIPKGAASILTSLTDTVHVWRPRYVDGDTGRISDDDLECVLLEVIRLWPPFAGSLRVARVDADVAGYLVPRGHAVFCATLAAHRDPSVFPYPDRFLPERWRTFNASDRDKIFGFGAGPHGCLGERFMWRFLMGAARALLAACTWDCPGDPEAKIERKVKYLPVLRPTELDEVRLERRGTKKT